MDSLKKYPRTHHIQGSRSQPGDEDLNDVPFNQIKGRSLIVEEKMDGSNCAISFGEENQLLLQSRGHYLTGGPRERHFALFKTWAASFTNELFEILGQRYIMYGEWLYAKHTMFYDALPHYFMEFDIFDIQDQIFLDTPSRQELLKEYPFIVPVKVLHQGPLNRLKDLEAFLGPSFFLSDDFILNLKSIASSMQLNSEVIIEETDCSGDMEGLYLKVEENGVVTERYKYVRKDFMTRILNSGSHWLDRPVIPNQLAAEVDIFAR